MNNLKLVIIAVFSVLILEVSVLLCVVPRPAYSDSEKRPLASFPTFSMSSYLAGDFTADISTYYNDTIPGRDFFKDLTGQISGLWGIRLGDVKLYGVNDNSGVIRDEEDETTAETENVFFPEDAEAAVAGTPETEPVTQQPEETEPTAPETEAVTEPVTEAVTEPVTEEPQPETEPVTEAVTEAVTESNDEVIMVIVNKEHVDMYRGDEYTFDVRLRLRGNPDRNVTVTVEPASVAEHIGNFAIRAKSVGEATVTFSASNGVKTSCTITVTENPDAGAVVDEYLSQYGIIIDGTRAMSLYGGSYKAARTYMTALEQYYDALDGKVNVYSMVIPTASAFYCPPKYAKYNASQMEMCNYIRDNLSSKIKHVEVYSPLFEHKDEDLYLRTDHHWSPLGAYYAAKAFAETAGVPFSDLSTFESHTIKDFLGSMYYSYTQDPVLLNNPEDFIYYTPTGVTHSTTYRRPDGTGEFSSAFFIPMSNRGGAYCTFMGGDDKITHVTTSAGTGRKLVIIKESFGNAIPGYLFGAFDDIYVIDLRYFELNTIEFIKETGATDLLFATCTFTASGPVSLFTNLLTQAP